MWLRLRQGDSIDALIDQTSLQCVYKHWTGSKSELCLGKVCPHCQEGKPTQRRYHARVLVDKEPYDWELGEQTMASLARVLNDNDRDNWLPILITRTGVGRNTRVRVTSAARDQQPTPPASNPNPNDKYIKGRYGHMVQR